MFTTSTLHVVDKGSWVEVHSVCTYWTQSWSWSSKALCTKRFKLKTEVDVHCTKCFKLKYTTRWTKCVLSLQIRTSCIRLSPLYISQCIAHHNNFTLHSLHSRVPTIAQCIHIIAQCTVHTNCTQRHCKWFDPLQRLRAATHQTQKLPCTNCHKLQQMLQMENLDFY